MVNPLKVKKVKLDSNVMERSKKMIKKDRLHLKLVPPKKAADETRRKTITYRMLSVAKKKIEMASTEDTEKCLKNIKNEVTFYTRGKKYGTVDVISDSDVPLYC